MIPSYPQENLGQPLKAVCRTSAGCTDCIAPFGREDRSTQHRAVSDHFLPMQKRPRRVTGCIRCVISRGFRPSWRARRARRACVEPCSIPVVFRRVRRISIGYQRLHYLSAQPGGWPSADARPAAKCFLRRPDTSVASSRASKTWRRVSPVSLRSDVAFANCIRAIMR